MTLINGEPQIEQSTAGHAPERLEGSILAIDIAIRRWERREKSEQPWTLCAWDGIERKASDIRALVPV